MVFYIVVIIRGDSMSIEEINQEMLNTLSLKQKADLKARLESNLKIQKMLYNYEKNKDTQDKER